MKGRKGSIDEGGVRVPCLVRWPGHIPAGTRIPQIAGAIDLLPTLADMAGVKRIGDKPLDGKSVKPLLLGEAGEWPDRTILSFKGGEGRKGPQVSVRTQRFRLDADGQLFDMTADPGQRRNVAVEHAELAAKLARLADEHGKELQPALAASKTRPFTVGYGPSTTLPARDGVPHGNVRRSARAPNNSFFTDWTSPDDAIAWDVEVGRTGDYEATVYYTCPAGDVGSTVELSMSGGGRATANIAEAFDPPLVGAVADRCPRDSESLVKDFKPLSLGTIKLDRGRGTLTLRASKVAGKRVADVSSVVLDRRE